MNDNLNWYERMEQDYPDVPACRRLGCERAASVDRTDGYCSARCKKRDRYSDLKDVRSRRVVGESGWF
jgi:hypothetical protein